MHRAISSRAFRILAPRYSGTSPEVPVHATDGGGILFAMPHRDLLATKSSTSRSRSA